MCDATHNNPYVLVLTAVTNVCRCIVFIADYVIVFLYQWLYDIRCVLLSFWFLPGLLCKVFVVFLKYTIHSMSMLGKGA